MEQKLLIRTRNRIISVAKVLDLEIRNGYEYLNILDTSGNQSYILRDDIIEYVRIGGKDGN